MAVLIFFIVLGVFAGILVFRRLICNGVLENAATNYARFSAAKIVQMIGKLDSPAYWQLDGDGLSHILTMTMRARGIARIEILGLDGKPFLEQIAVEKLPGEVIQGRYPIVFNMQPQGWVLVSLAIPSIEETWWSLGFLTLAHVVTQVTRNYGLLISDEIAVLIGELEEPEYWEYDADKLSAVLANALQIDGITRVNILDGRGNLLAEKEKEKEKEKDFTAYVTDVQTNIIYNNTVVGRVTVYLDFPGIRLTTWKLQMSAFIMALLLLCMLYLVSTRTVSRLEKSLVTLYSELETKVAERTEQLTQVNSQLRTELGERKKLEATLIQTEKMSAVGQLAAGVAHEINNPLGIILGFAQSAMKRLQPSDVLALPIKSIEREALRCKNLVQNLLTFSRQGKSRVEQFDLNETVESTLGIVEAQARVKSVEVFKELGGVEPLLGDKNQMQQVIVNLCNNAIDAMPNGGKIVVRTRSDAADSRRVVLEVEDNGSGIPEEIRDKIFNPFFTTKEVGKGTGLGLSLVYEIIQRHKGTITLRSKVGQGTTFTVLLPASEDSKIEKDNNGSL